MSLGITLSGAPCTPPPDLHSAATTVTNGSNIASPAPQSQSQLDDVLRQTSASPQAHQDTPYTRDEFHPSADVDAQILEALKSGKDRLYVLKLGEQMEALITESNVRTRLDLNPETTYQRLLIHRCAAYYKLAPEAEPITRGISVLVTLESRLPSRRLSDLVPAEETAHPTFKIMRRSLHDRNRSRTSHSRPGSVAGEDRDRDGGDLSDVEPSEAGSTGGRSSASKKRMTIEEREAAYQEARSRIFMDFEEKEKAKERDTSASSSTLSLVSGSAGSASGGGSGSVGDIDDAGSTAPTESEWSGPVSSRDVKDVRRGGGPSSNSPISSRSLRTSNSSFTGRRSGTSSPAFSYPSLYEPAPPGPPYDAPTGGGIPPHPAGYMAPYAMYPYPPPPPGGAPGQPYMPPYAFYPPYGYPPPPPPPQPQHPNSDPTTPSSGPHDPYAPPPPMTSPPSHPQNPYANAYMWAQPPPPPPPGHPLQQQHQPHQPPPPLPQHQQHQPQPHHPQPHPVDSQHMQGHPPHRQSPSHSAPPPPPPGPAQYQPYPYMAQGPYGPYPMPPYYHPGGTPPAPPAQPVHSHSQPTFPVDFPQLHQNGGLHNGNGNGDGGHYMDNNHNSRSHMQNHVGPSSSSGHNSNNGAKINPPAARTAWSYGPGITMGGIGYGGGSQVSGPYSNYGQNGTETVGPRLSGSMRRTSGNSVGSGSGGNRTPGDETASTTSSSTSSSTSLRTFRSTGSSKHPLPARPDWAAGLKPHPTLHNRNRDSNNSSRNSSGHQSPNRAAQQLPPIMLQATDFPPLSGPSGVPVEKRNVPMPGGVWTNAGGARAVLQQSPRQVDGVGHGNSHQHQQQHHNQGQNNANGVGSSAGTRLDEHGFDRPPPKSAELFNPNRSTNSNGSRRSGSSSSTSHTPEKGEKDKERARGDAVASAILVDRVAALKLQQEHAATTSKAEDRDGQGAPRMFTPVDLSGEDVGGNANGSGAAGGPS